MDFKLAKNSDVPEGKGLIVKGPEGEDIALFKWQGKVYALNNACPHQGGPLGAGEIENNIVTCPWHGLQFNICTGSCVDGIDDDATSVPLVERDGFIYLSL